MPTETILVVDDSEEMLRILQDDVLQPLGYQVICAPDGQTGLEVALSAPVDLIMLDMNMPKLSGIEVLQALRQAGSEIPVIFMTIFGSEKIVTQAFRLGVSDYLSKPFKLQEVEKAVDHALKTRRMERERAEMERNLLASETVRKTVITLSHYLNNYLTALNGGLALLEENLEQQTFDPAQLQLLSESQASARRIQAVIQVLRKVTQVDSIPYAGQAQMFDIETALRQALAAENLTAPETMSH
jgi:DNA-binding response OmpR family regulator